MISVYVPHAFFYWLDLPRLNEVCNNMFKGDVDAYVIIFTDKQALVPKHK